MRDASSALWRVLRSNNPVVVVLYEDADLRDELIAEMEALAPAGQATRRISDVEEAFRDSATLLFLTPEDERQAISTLDGRRESMLERKAPLVLLLIRGGSGVQSLSEASGLASWIAGSEIDPHGLEQVDVPRERERFKQQTGLWPEEWLREYRSGRIHDTLENGLWATRAGLLEEPA